MMQVHENIYIGNDKHCFWSGSPDWAVIHACKHPCHRRALGYTNNLSANHPNYLIVERNNHLVLNLVDMEQELSPRFTNPIMKVSMSFIEGNLAKRNKILIHCNQGQSRSPSIALLYLARKNHIDSHTYFKAAESFRVYYPLYNPGKGIAAYLNRNWETLLLL